MKLKITLATLIALGLSGCTSSMDLNQNNSNRLKPTVLRTNPQTNLTESEKQASYQETMRNIAAGIKDDPQYDRIALDTEEKKAWFKSLTYRLWDKQITSEAFMIEGLDKYPTHEYEFNFIINGFAKH